MQWFYHQHGSDFNQLSTFSLKLREHLLKHAQFGFMPVVQTHQSADGTVKWLHAVNQGELVESVLIPDGKRNTLCISSQVGCMLDCSFCATGKQGFNGNLSSANIVSQMMHAQNWLLSNRPGQSVSNVVFMGMGEPLLNFDSVMTAADLAMDDMALGLSKRRVTISTAGVVPQIEAMVGRTEAALAVSLHASYDELRDKLVPVNRKFPIKRLLTACQKYLDSLDSKRIVTFEYTLIAGVNDSIRDARGLHRLIGGIRNKVNLIPFNSFRGSEFKRPAIDTVKAFQLELVRLGTRATLRTTRGDDISAACGQLVGTVQDRTRRNERFRRKILPTTQLAV